MYAANRFRGIWGSCFHRLTATFIVMNGMLAGSAACGEDELPLVIPAPGRTTASVRWMDQLDEHIQVALPVDEPTRREATIEGELSEGAATAGEPADDKTARNESTVNPKPRSWPKRLPKQRWIVDRPGPRRRASDLQTIPSATSGGQKRATPHSRRLKDATVAPGNRTSRPVHAMTTTDSAYQVPPPVRPSAVASADNEQDSSRTAERIVRSPASVRWTHERHEEPMWIQEEPAICADDGCLTQSNEHWRPEGISQPWPADEYLCDGGDTNARVVVSRAAQVSGLDPEDTVVHFDTADGRTIVKPTNSVCIYAPRFAAVRKVHGMRAEERLLRAQIVDQPLPTLTQELSQPPNILNQPEQTERLLDIDGAMALRDRVRGLELENGQRVAELVRDFEAFENFQIMRIGIDKSADKARLAESITAAIVWSEAEAPEVLVDLVEATVDTTYAKAGVLYQLDDGPPCLRVIKLASTRSARPGEVVEFAIRFDNIGEQTVENVTVIDNLTTRLEYVPDSSQSDRDAKFFSDENDSESLTLRWQINEPLRPGDGGIIRFKCKVR